MLILKVEIYGITSSLIFRQNNCALLKIYLKIIEFEMLIKINLDKFPIQHCPID